jgi:5-methylthioribose kinase
LPDSSDDIKSIENLLPEWGISNIQGPILTILGGGVSNLVVKVEMRNGEKFVVKSSLPKLRVNEDWFADRGRIVREAACLRVIAKYVRQEFAPKVLREDASNFACLLECAPEGTVTWKKDLMNGKAEPAVTEKVAFFLSKFHGKTREDKAIQNEFGDQTNFVQLRINPYLVRISERHPDLKEPVDEIISGLLSEKLCLVHGDFSPKNILLLPDARVWIIDCEVAHYGNPAFDVAFCANHLILKSIHLASLRHLEEAGRLWRNYWQDSSWSRQERFTVRVLGGLMLARVDGKSPAEYLNEDDHTVIRDLSRQFVEDRVDDFSKVASIVEKIIRNGK